MENNILKQKLIDNGLLYTPVVVQDVLRDCLLILAHDKQGHNRFRRIYASLKNRYHWKGMKKSVYQHCTNCQVCAKHNIKTQQLKNKHFSSPPQPMEFIAMHLIGEFHPASSKGSKGNRFTLTAVCMLTGFTFCIPLKSKHAEDVIKAYIDHICCTFGPSRKILTDNGTEFKNKLWTEVFEKLRIHTYLFTTVQRQNRRIPQVPQSHNSKTTGNLHGMGRPSMESHSSIQLFPNRIVRTSTILPDVRS